MKANDKGVCNNCGHLGTQSKHSKSGCAECRQHSGCDETRWKYVFVLLVISILY